jgi:hypothetical protein
MRHGKTIIIQSFGARAFAYNWPQFERPFPQGSKSLINGRSFKTCKHAIPGKIQSWLTEQKFPNRRHGSSSVGARPSSAAPIELKPLDRRHGGSSVGARPSSAAPIEFPRFFNCYVLGPPSSEDVEGEACHRASQNLVSGFYSMGAAEDGRAPTEELPYLR